MILLIFHQINIIHWCQKLWHVLLLFGMIIFYRKLNKNMFQKSNFLTITYRYIYIFFYAEQKNTLTFIYTGYLNAVEN